jgi:hypothetical protein
MASTGKVDVTVRGGGFDVGEKVGVSVKHGDFYLPGQDRVRTTTVTQAGEVVVSGLDPGVYWVHRLEEPYRAITVHAKQRPAAAEKPSADVAQKRLEATRPVTGRAGSSRGRSIRRMCSCPGRARSSPGPGSRRRPGRRVTSAVCSTRATTRTRRSSAACGTTSRRRTRSAARPSATRRRRVCGRTSPCRRWRRRMPGTCRSGRRP